MKKNPHIRLLIVDDHPALRKGLREVEEIEPQIEVVGEADDGLAAGKLAAQLEPEVIVMDVAMPNLNGIEATRQIVTAHPKIAVVILSMHSDESYVMRALKAGARGYLLKDSAEAELIQAVRTVVTGKSFFSAVVSKMLLEDYVRNLQQRGIEDSYDLLTPREREVLQLAAEGKSNKESAAMLNLSAHTVETHRTNLMQKLNLHSVPELILYAVRKGIIR